MALLSGKWTSLYAPAMSALAVEDIDGSFVPLRAPVASVELDGEMVLAGGPGHAFYRLDAVASLVWAGLDGSGTAEEIAGDLAAELGAPPSVVAGDVLGLTRTLGRLCFVEGVRCEEAPLTEVAAPVSTVPGVGRHLVEPPSG